MYTSFTEMPVWQLAMDVAEDIFLLTAPLPKKEDYGLTSQLRRAAVSIAANLAEGFGRRGNKDKQKFYDYARGSAFETQSHLLYGIRVHYFTEDACHTVLAKLNQIIHDINKINKALGLD
ncbi:MAG: four helix bundle protein [Sediminibacterium sp.]